MKLGIKITESEINDNEIVETNYISIDELPEGYEDITSAKNWDKYGDLVTDYLFYRYEIQCLLIPKCNPNYPTIDFSGWSNLTNSEKFLMCKYILAPYQLRLTVQDDNDDEKCWFNLLNITQGVRAERFTGRALLIEKMRKCVANKVRKEEMEMAVTQQFFKDVFLFIQYYIAAAAPDFMLWLTNAEGTEFESDGFAQKTYYTEELKNELMDIYEGKS